MKINIEIITEKDWTNRMWRPGAEERLIDEDTKNWNNDWWKTEETFRKWETEEKKCLSRLINEVTKNWNKDSTKTSERVRKKEDWLSKKIEELRRVKIKNHEKTEWMNHTWTTKRDSERTEKWRKKKMIKWNNDDIRRGMIRTKQRTTKKELNMKDWGREVEINRYEDSLDWNHWNISLLVPSDHLSSARIPDMINWMSHGQWHNAYYQLSLH